jgi:hypothetical protein
MRHGTQGRRSRNRGHGGGQGGQNGGNNGGQQQRRGGVNRNQIFDSNGPDVRIRGTAHQVCEKYLALAKDAAAAGDIVLGESYLQHAEHYQRIINSWADEFQGAPQRQGNPSNEQPSIEDDLALPVSILGGDVKTPSQADVRSNTYESEELLETA